MIKKIQDIFLEEERLGIKGLSLGSPLSPILSNIYMCEFDKYFQGLEDIIYVRFADDMMFLSNENILLQIEKQLKNINLNISEEKTFIGSYGESIKFLGFDIKKENFQTVLYPKYNSHNKLEKVNSIIENFNEEDFINILKEISIYNDIKEEDIEKILNLIKGKLGIVYVNLFKYIVLKYDKYDLIENLLENKEFEGAYKFEDLISKVDSKDKVLKCFMDRFIIRKEEYYLCKMEGKKEYIKINEPITKELILKHFKGAINIAVRLDKDNKSNILVFDVDSKDINKSKKVTEDLKDVLKEEGYESYTEFSGKKGYHLWCFFNEFIEVEKINNFAKNVLELISVEKDVEIEIRPKSNFIEETENIIKLSEGYHPETMKKCEFLNFKEPFYIFENTFTFDNKEKFLDFMEQVKCQFPEANKIIENCIVVKNILEKSICKSSMKHFERLIMLCIFYHIEKGENFLHFIMENMENYSYNITERYISNAPEKPISCRKIREYIRDTEFSIYCSCNFQLQNGMYESPIIYADKGEFIKNSINNNIKDNIEEIFRLKEERERINKRIKKLQNKINSIYKSLNCKQIDLDIGVLKKIENENEEDYWVIELKI
ncbi:reverse transcriptase [Clostridium acetireducens DSM 10703]|uniref:Reverse transcriptase n=1 Tax=Clostridium acetireducens DSM 10703 TaxID=1121290 RepID=A0A1E8F0W1_9CLOT|nr:reverse transcriptase domain-containing protein [Clostridium acetireducens]OFI07052.1 reverse transcriptase [Clostridium acetireducens DSM 10703]